MCELKATKRYSAVGGNDASGKDRTGPTSCCVRLCCSQSQLAHQPARTSDKMADRAELFDSKMRRQIDPYYKPKNRLEYAPPCIIQYRIYTSMGISAKPIAAAMGKGRYEKCEFVGQHSFASLTSCRLNIVARMCEFLWQATATLTS